MCTSVGKGVRHGHHAANLTPGVFLSSRSATIHLKPNVYMACLTGQSWVYQSSHSFQRVNR